MVVVVVVMGVRRACDMSHRIVAHRRTRETRRRKATLETANSEEPRRTLGNARMACWLVTPVEIGRGRVCQAINH